MEIQVRVPCKVCKATGKTISKEYQKMREWITTQQGGGNLTPTYVLIMEYMNKNHKGNAESIKEHNDCKTCKGTKYITEWESIDVVADRLKEGLLRIQ